MKAAKALNGGATPLLLRSSLACLSFLWHGPSVHAAPAAEAALPVPPAMRGIDVEEQIGQRIPRDLVFTDSEGHEVRLGDFLHPDRPVLLTLAYYRCPMLCDLVVRGLSETMKRIRWTPGKDFHAITVSIDPADTPGTARVKKLNALRAMSQPQRGEGWAFLIDRDRGNAQRLADAVGFRYRYDEESGQYAHPAVAMVLTPDGRVSRYLYGVAYRPLDVRLAMTEAGTGKVGGFVERVLLTCFRFDPSTRRYGFVINAVLKGGAALVLVGVFGSLVGLWRLDRRRQRRLRDRSLPSHRDRERSPREPDGV